MAVGEVTYTDEGLPIYGGSIGINPFIDLLVQRGKSDKTLFFEALLINFYTILRNCFDKDPRVVEKNIEQELIHLGTYISEYVSTVLKHDQTMTIPVIIYFPTYSEIQAPVLRELTAEMHRLVTVAPKIKTVMLKSLRGEDKLEMGAVTFFFKEVGDRYHLPYHHLDLIMQKLTADKQSRFTGRSPYLLMSHIAVDWHLVGHFPNMALFESYTGKIITADELGDKLVNDKVKRGLPFTPMIHRVFGDKTLIKPLVTHKRKSRMLAAAEKWKRKPTSMIVSEIAEISEQPTSYIRSLKL